MLGLSSILTTLIIHGYGGKHFNCSAGFRKRLRACMLQPCDATPASLHDHLLREAAFEVKTRKMHWKKSCWFRLRLPTKKGPLLL